MKVTAKSTIKNIELLQEHEILKHKRYGKLYEELLDVNTVSEISNSKKHMIREDCKPNNRLEQSKKLHKLNKIKSNVNRKYQKSNS